MAYALISLIKILEQDQHHLVFDNSSHKHQFVSFLEEARRLKSLVEEYYIRSQGGIETSLECRIRDVVYKAEDMIEFHVLDQCNSQFDLSGMVAEFEHIKTEMLSENSTSRKNEMLSENLISSSDSETSSELQVNTIGGIGHDINQITLEEHAQAHPAENQIQVGSGWMSYLSQKTGSVGSSSETNHARKDYESIAFRTPELTSSWLDDLAEWEMPPDYYIALPAGAKIDTQKLKNFPALRQNNVTSQEEQSSGPITSVSANVDRVSLENTQAAEITSHAADRIQSPLRDQFSRKRHQRETEVKSALTVQKKYRGRKGRKEFHILHEKIVTLQAQTKKANSEVASSLLDLSKIHDASWNLLQSKVFGLDSIPPELEVIGKKIAKACIDHPLAINIIAAFLSSHKYEQRLWELVESKVSSIGTADVIYSNILSVIYDHLPFHLKACFLYVGVFPQAVEIKSSRIIKLWIAEGYVEPMECSFEETAGLCLEGLIDRHLLSVSREVLDGKPKVFEVDFHVNKFCQEKAREENFLWFKDSREQSILEDRERRVSLHPLSEPTNTTTSESRARSFLCMGCASIRIALSFHRMRLLRVLDIYQLEFHRFPKEMLQLVLLRYLAFSCHSDLPSAISRFLNLQTLIIRRLPSSRAFTLPPGLWELTQLRHVISKQTCIWYYPRDKEDVLQENLQTLSNIHVFLLTDKFIGSIRNLTKLGIFCDSSFQTIICLDRLKNLERLKCTTSWLSVTQGFLSHIRFPPSLKKLTLNSCKLPWKVMTAVGSLPNLEHLKLQNSDFLSMGLESEFEPVEPEWVPNEGEFIRLRFLFMEELNLVHWRAHANHFPSLQRLVIQDCCSMTEIPLDIGEIETLKVIEVDDTNPSLLDSANQIKNERSLIYDFLQLHIRRR